MKRSGRLNRRRTKRGFTRAVALSEAYREYDEEYNYKCKVLVCCNVMVINAFGRVPNR